MLYALECDCFWWALHVNMKICNLMLLDGVFYNYQLDQADWYCCSNILSVIHCLLELSVIERRVLKFLTITTDLYISSCSSSSFCVIYFDTLFSGANMLRIAMSSRITYPLSLYFVPIILGSFFFKLIY